MEQNFNSWLMKRILNCVVPLIHEKEMRISETRAEALDIVFAVFRYVPAAVWTQYVEF